LRDFGFGKGSMEELIKDEVVDLISEFKKELNRSVVLESRFNMAVLNALWHIISGERYSHDDPKLSHLLKIMSEDFEKVQVQGPTLFMPWLATLFPKLTGFDSIMNTLNLTYAFLQESITAHKKTFDPNNPRDLIDVYLKEIQNTTDPNSSFLKEEGEKEMLVVLLDLFGAGGDTTSTSLCWAILYLITNPEIQKKAQKELDSVVGTSRLPSLADRPRMPYMEALIAETMRMSSIVPLIFRSTTESVEFHGYTLPKNTLMFGNFHKFHHDKEHWGDPENFRPERFIDEDGKFKKDEMLNPFSIGKRICPGEGLAKDETFLFLSGLLQQLYFERDPNSPQPTLEGKPSLITKTYPYNVIIKDRKSLKSEE
jgi:cytochrome P450